MKVVFASKTGNVRRLVDKLSKNKIEVIEIQENLIIDFKAVLITYTAPQGKVPSLVESFIQSNKNNIISVVCSGNLNWGKTYCKAADLIFEKYQIPTLLKLELSGTNKDVDFIIDFINK